MSDDAIDFDARELCPDDTCIGVLGPDGRCKVCGRGAVAGVAGAAGVATEPSVAAPAVADDDAFSDDDERELCPDDACIGLIGPDGHCKECGRPRQS